MIAILWWLTSALALGGLYLESTPVPTREPVEAMAARAEVLGCPGTIVRRYVAGQGWGFIYRSGPGLSDEEMEHCVNGLQEAGHDDLRILRQTADGSDTISRTSLTSTSGPASTSENVVTEQLATTTPAQPDTLATSPKVSLQPDAMPPNLANHAEVSVKAPHLTAEGVVARLVRSHQALGANGKAWKHDVLFKFRRTLRDGAIVEHIFARHGDDIYLQVDIISGSGVPSKAGIVDGHAWFSTPTPEPLDLALVRRNLLRFSPEHVLQRAWALANGNPEIDDLSRLVLGEQVDANGQKYWIVVDPGTQNRPTTRLEIDSKQWQLHAAARGDAGTEVVRTYLGWVEIEGGGLRPTSVKTTHGDDVLDAISVLELNAAPTFPPEWFILPQHNESQ